MHTTNSYYSFRIYRLIIPMILLGFGLSNCTEDDPEPLQPEFSWSPISVETGQSVVFNNSSKGDPKEFSWTFESGTPTNSKQENPSVQFSNPGEFDVTLTISRGNSSESITKKVTVTCGQNSCMPIDANFSGSSTSIEIGNSIQFIDQSTGIPTSWEWTFEGGTPEISTEQNPTVRYKLSGPHSVTLKASKEGSDDTEIKENYISVECVIGFKSGQSINVNNVSRSYDLLLPKDYCNSADLPVIIDLHATSSTKEAQRSFSGFDEIANANNIIMVWPQALELTTCLNNANRWNANLISSPDDIGFISALIDNLIANYQVDEKRIYVTGMSNGGFMTYSLACALSTKIAAIASVGGTMTDNLLTTICQPSRAVPVLEIHGTADQICDYDGYTNCEGHQASVDDVIAFWRAKGNCSADYDEFLYENINTNDGCTARMLTYQGCSTNNSVKLVIVDGGGHTWPGSEPYYNFYLPYKDFLFPMNFDINASAIIWDFFSQHHLPE